MYVDPDKCRKAFHFDLDYHAICEVFGRKNTATPYSKIKSFMLAHGFEKAQYSGYLSKEPMSETDFYKIYGTNYIRYASGTLSRIFDRAIVPRLITKNPSRKYGTLAIFFLSVVYWSHCKSTYRNKQNNK